MLHILESITVIMLHFIQHFVGQILILATAFYVVKHDVKFHLDQAVPEICPIHYLNYQLQVKFCEVHNWHPLKIST